MVGHIDYYFHLKNKFLLKYRQSKSQFEQPLSPSIVNPSDDYVPTTGPTELNPFDHELRDSSDFQLGYPTLHELPLHHAAQDYWKQVSSQPDHCGQGEAIQNFVLICVHLCFPSLLVLMMSFLLG